MNILFSNAGRRTYLIRYALQIAAREPGMRVFASDATLTSAALNVSPEVTPLVTPFVSDSEEGYAQALLDLCQRHRIDVVVPLMDFEIPVLARWRARFREAGVTVWVSSPEVVDACLDKQLFHAYCERLGLSTPRSWFGEDLTGLTFPAIRKKRLGSGSVGLGIVRSASELPDYDPEYFYQEFIEGVEYGMDVFNDLDGRYVHSYCREKLLMRAGETDKARTFSTPAMVDVAREVSRLVGHVGNLDLDLIVGKDGRIQFIDFNPRFGGGYPFTHASGFDYLQVICDTAMGRAPSLPEKGRDIVGMKGLELYFYEECAGEGK